jgi:hypothetical protein
MVVPRLRGRLDEPTLLCCTKGLSEIAFTTVNQDSMRLQFRGSNRPISKTHDKSKMEQLMDNSNTKVYCGHYVYIKKPCDKSYITTMRQLTKALINGTDLAPVFRTPRKDSIFCQEVSRCQRTRVVDSTHNLSTMLFD